MYHWTISKSSQGWLDKSYGTRKILLDILIHIKETHKDILSNNKDRHKDCPMNMNTQHFSSWTNTRQMDKSKFFPLYFFNRTWDNVFYVLDTSSNMHGTHKNSPYGQTNQKNSLFFGFFLRASSDKLGLQILRSRTKKKFRSPAKKPHANEGILVQDWNG